MSDGNRDILIRSWEDINEDIQNNISVSPLDLFIVSSEPAGRGPEKVFRTDLQSAVSYVQEETRKE